MTRRDIDLDNEDSSSGYMKIRLDYKDIQVYLFFIYKINTCHFNSGKNNISSIDIFFSCRKKKIINAQLKKFAKTVDLNKF